MNDVYNKLFVSDELRNKVMTAVMDCFYMARKKWGDKIPNTPPVVEFNTFGKAAGYFIGKEGYTSSNGKDRVCFNPILLNENSTEVISDTVPHEMAHWVVYCLYPIRREYDKDYFGTWTRDVKPHGVEWKQVMGVFGVNPKRCHSMSTATITAMKYGTAYKYGCACKGKVFALSPLLHRRIKSGRSRRCCTCGKTLHFLG